MPLIFDSLPGGRPIRPRSTSPRPESTLDPAPLTPTRRTETWPLQNPAAGNPARRRPGLPRRRGGVPDLRAAAELAQHQLEGGVDIAGLSDDERNGVGTPTPAGRGPGVHAHSPSPPPPHRAPPAASAMSTPEVSAATLVDVRAHRESAPTAQLVDVGRRPPRLGHTQRNVSQEFATLQNPIERRLVQISEFLLESPHNNDASRAEHQEYITVLNGILNTPGPLGRHYTYFYNLIHAAHLRLLLLLDEEGQVGTPDLFERPPSPLRLNESIEAILRQHPFLRGFVERLRADNNVEPGVGPRPRQDARYLQVRRRQ